MKLIASYLSLVFTANAVLNTTAAVRGKTALAKQTKETSLSSRSVPARSLACQRSRQSNPTVVKSSVAEWEDGSRGQASWGFAHRAESSALHEYAAIFGISSWVWPMPSPVSTDCSSFAYTGIGELGTRWHQDCSRYCHPAVAFLTMKHGSKVRSGIARQADRDQAHTRD